MTSEEDDAEFLELISDRDSFEAMVSAGYGLAPEEARRVAAQVFFHYLTPEGRLLDCVIDEGDTAYFSREDRRDLVSLANLGLVAVRTEEVEKVDPLGHEREFRQYRYALHLDAMRQRLAALADQPTEDRVPEAVYADESLWTRRKGTVGN
jgi:hypothetical protein